MTEGNEVASPLHGHDSSHASDGKNIPFSESMGSDKRKRIRIGEDDVTDGEGGAWSNFFVAYGDDMDC